MAKTWEELEEEEALKHRKNILGAKSRRDIQKENERYEKARIRIGEMHTAQTLGSDWREREAKKRLTPEYRASRAQEALASNVAETRERNRKQLTPLEEGVTRRKMELPGGGTAEFGIGTLANMRAYEQKQKEAKEAQRSKVAESINRMREEFRERNKQRYEQNLAERGLRNPMEGATPEERRRIENENNAAKMADFRKQTSARQLAGMKEREFEDMYADMPKSFKDRLIGGDSSNMTARRSYFERLANAEVRRELSDRADVRRKINAMRTSANPEAASATGSDFTPKATGAPIGVGTDSLTYDQKPVVGDAMNQPFGMVPPQGIDRGVSFGAISPANVEGDTNIPDSAVIGAEESKPPTKPFFPQPKPSTPIPMTSTERTDEDVLPGISSMPEVERQPGESASQYNKRVLDEYTKSVILPSLDEIVQSAYSSAMELNELEKQLYRQRFVNPKQYEEVATKTKEQHDILKNAIDDLRREMRSYPPNSREHKFKSQQIAVLKKQLGFFAKRLY